MTRKASWAWFVSVHKWISDPLLLAFVVALTMTSVVVQRRWGPMAGHTAGALAAVFGCLLVDRLVHVALHRWEGDPMLPVTITLTAGIVLCV